MKQVKSITIDYYVPKTKTIKVSKLKDEKLYKYAQTFGKKEEELTDEDFNLRTRLSLADLLYAVTKEDILTSYLDLPFDVMHIEYKEDN